MKQKYYHYTMWEDFQNRMYDEVKEGRPERVKQAACLLQDTESLYKQMRKVTQEWKYATEQNLTNTSINHQAFLGQTACNIYAGIKEDETREAWGGSQMKSGTKQTKWLIECIRNGYMSTKKQTI